MPSGASDEWSGVAGIRKLIGSKAFLRLEEEERDRVMSRIHSFIPNKGIVVTFQKNCWESLKSDTDPVYSSPVVKREGLKGHSERISQSNTFMCSSDSLCGPFMPSIKTTPEVRY